MSDKLDKLNSGIVDTTTNNTTDECKKIDFSQYPVFSHKGSNNGSDKVRNIVNKTLASGEKRKNAIKQEQREQQEDTNL